MNNRSKPDLGKSQTGDIISENLLECKIINTASLIKLSAVLVSIVSPFLLAVQTGGSIGMFIVVGWFAFIVCTFICWLGSID